MVCPTKPARCAALLGLLAVLLVPGARAAEASRERVVVHLKGGARIQATLVAEGEESVTLSTRDGTLTLSRASIERIERPGSTQGGPASPRTRPSRVERAPVEKLGPSGLEPWPGAEEQEIEGLLDRFFAAKDDAARRAAFGKLSATRLSRGFDELERMREAAKRRGVLRHLPVPWRKGASRAWFNLAIPKDYSPAKAWPLVLALHGMPSDGDNLVSWYSRYFPQRGTIVLFPTTIHRSSYWPAPAEKRELLKLVQHLCTQYRIDARRIYCTGASGGGIGTWHWLVTVPELFVGGISFSAAGTISDKRLEKLKGIPFYVHHGTRDYVPIASAERAVAAARRHGADKIEFYVSKGTGHTPPARDWNRAFDWLVKLPPKDVSPRYLLESPEGVLPFGYRRYLTFAVAPEREALAKILAGYKGKVAAWEFPTGMPRGGLVEGLVHVSKIVDPACDMAAVRRELKRIADAVRKTAKAGSKPVEMLYALNEAFFHAEGFARDGSDPSGAKPEGVVVSHVLRSRQGNVFALTGVYVAIASELGLPVFPVVTPYHAFARYDDGTETVNVEMTEGGGHFDDGIYRVGYGLPTLPSAAVLKERGTPTLLGAQLGALGTMARQAGSTEKAETAAGLALKVDPKCYGALLLSALLARDAKQPKRVLKHAWQVTKLWPEYAEPRLLDGEARLATGAGDAALRAFRAGVRAHIKPHAAANAFDAELYYRIAEIHAQRLRRAMKANSPAVLGLSRKFNDAIVNCLKRNGGHARAAQLLQQMGGSYTRKPGGPRR